MEIPVISEWIMTCDQKGNGEPRETLLVLREFRGASEDACWWEYILNQPIYGSTDDPKEYALECGYKPREFTLIMKETNDGNKNG